jgi:hypothetical protein
VVEDQQPAGGLGDDGRRAGPSLDERDLAEELARTELVDLLPVPLHGDQALHEDHQVVTEVSLPDQDLAGGDVHLLRQHPEAFQVLVVEPRKDRDAAQQFELLVAGHRRSSVVRRGAYGLTPRLRKTLAARCGMGTGIGPGLAAMRVRQAFEDRGIL